MPDGVPPAVEQLRPLHGPIEMDAAAGLPPLVALVVVLLVLAVAGLLVLRYFKSTQVLGPAAIAERELVRLLGLGLTEQGRVKEHYALLATCLRRYVAAVYGVPAASLTTTELGAALAPEPVDAGFKDYVRRVLRTGDLVRFDHTGRTVAEARADVLGALDVIRATSSPPASAAA
jgi:hypothetical protein